MTLIRTELDNTRLSSASFTLREVMFTMVPPSPSRRCGSASRARRTTLITSSSYAAAQSSSSVSRNAPEGGPPALVTR